MGMLLVQAEIRGEEQEWAHLIARTAKGDQAAFGMLYDKTSARIYGLVLRVLGDRASAEEVTLDVFTQVWWDARRYDADRGSPSTWLLTLARSRAIDRLRAGMAERERRAPLETAEALPHEGEDPEQSSVGNERQRLVHHALAELVSEQRDAITLAYFSGLSQSEIAAKLGLPLGTVKTRIRLGMIQLRDVLAAYEEGRAL